GCWPRLREGEASAGAELGTVGGDIECKGPHAACSNGRFARRKVSSAARNLSNQAEGHAGLARGSVEGGEPPPIDAQSEWRPVNGNEKRAACPSVEPHHQPGTARNVPRHHHCRM